MICGYFIVMAIVIVIVPYFLYTVLTDSSLTRRRKNTTVGLAVLFVLLLFDASFFGMGLTLMLIMRLAQVGIALLTMIEEVFGQLLWGVSRA